MELTVMSRILRNFGNSCVTLCHIDSRKYFSPYLQDGSTILCYKILWPYENWSTSGTLSKPHST